MSADEGRPAPRLTSLDELTSLEETLDLLGDREAIDALVEAEAAVASGDVVHGTAAIRALRPRGWCGLIDDDAHDVTVLRVEHGGDAHRSR